MRISSPIFSQGNPLPGPFRQGFRFRLNENIRFGWTPQLTTREFQSLLSNITAIKIRATYSQASIGLLDDVSLETAVERTGYEPANWIETCTCPEGYDGQFCELCYSGYKRDPPNGGKFAKCVPCTCNQHGDFCHAESGL